MSGNQDEATEATEATASSPPDPPIVLQMKPLPAKRAEAPASRGPKVICRRDGQPDLLAMLQEVVNELREGAAQSACDAKEAEIRGINSPEAYTEYLTASIIAQIGENFAGVLVEVVNAWSDAAKKWKASQS